MTLIGTIYTTAHHTLLFSRFLFSAFLSSFYLFILLLPSHFFPLFYSIFSFSSYFYFSFSLSKCDTTYFPPGERYALARTIFRKHDREHMHQCDKANCGGDCAFVACRCANTNCVAVFSRCWGPRHDSVCPHKMVYCDRVCGDLVPRMTLKSHRDNACVLRLPLNPFLPTVLPSVLLSFHSYLFR